MSDQVDKIKQLAEMLNVPEPLARQALEQHGWDLNDSLDHLTNQSIAPSESSPKPAPSASSGSRTPVGQGSSFSSSRRFATLSDLANSNASPSRNSHDEDEDEKDWFTGGEKSALAVHKPPKNRQDALKSGNKLVDDIIRRSQQQAERGHESDESEDEQDQTPAFSGTGYRLGAPGEAVIPAPGTSNSNRPLPRVTRRLTFWRDGFSVEDGPLYRYDDPNNLPFLQAIEQGRAPMSILNVQIGQGVDVHVSRKLDEDYKKPKVVGGFHGSGQRLGSPALGGVTSNSASKNTTPEPSVTKKTEPSEESKALQEPENADTTIQIQVLDGTRHRRRFVSSGPVQQIYDFVDSVFDSNNRDYCLQTTFPMKKLDNKELTIKEAGVGGAVVVQRWV